MGLFGDAIRAIGDDNGGDMGIEFSLQTPCLELLGPLTSPVPPQSLWVVVYFFSVGLRMLLLGSYRGKALTFPSPPLPFETRRLVPPEERICRHIAQEVAGMIWLSTYFPILSTK